ncbi:MAG: TRAP-type C4-dicarboxylate transport system permease small subunit [Candidatus Azotimanducaceae bacterium]|jgi:TRAP-type C4-dicarboxylate transport system permease small subunit
MILRGHKARRVADTIIAALAAALVVLFSAMVLLVLIQVIDRFVPNFGWFWTEEVVRILLVWCVMLGLPIMLYNYEEIIVDLFSLKPRLAIWRLRLAVALSIIFLFLLAKHGYTFTLRSANFTSPTLGISRAWIYSSIPIGATLGCMALLIRAESRAPSYPVHPEVTNQLEDDL